MDKTMVEKYKPTFLVEAVYQLTPEMLKKHGFKAVLTDLDNTLIAWNNPLGTPELHTWLEELKQAEIPVVVISNNSHKRIEKAVAPFGIQFVSRAMKPMIKGFREAEKLLNLKPSELVMLGDQLMTDICGSNRAGIASVLVKPVVQSDSFATKFNRMRERRVWKKLEKKYDMTFQEGI
ncbi:YqeG family HAD IIIA-type phosphatase [Pilibacter termitis]|nr:YqeG family HAD IIIA-type phosphatase [Pilibacter termitis]